MMAAQIPAPVLDDIVKAKEAISPWILQTPVWQLRTGSAADVLGPEGSLFYKFECWQHAGTFKARGAIASMLQLTTEQLKKGVTAVSAGNHAIAVSYAAKCFGVNAKVLMPKTASPTRIQQSRALGAEVVLTNDMCELFERVERIQENEGRILIHPYEGYGVALGTGSLGLELCQQVSELDAVLVAVGGGGLASGMACAIKQLQPGCKVYGIEPTGACVLSESLSAGKPVKVSSLDTIADSLAAPHAEPFSFGLYQRYVDETLTVDDDQIRHAMHWMFDALSMAVEPAAAAATAALLGPLRARLQGKRVAVLLCGSNIDLKTFCQICHC